MLFIYITFTLTNDFQVFLFFCSFSLSENKLSLAIQVIYIELVVAQVKYSLKLISIH